MEWRVGAAALKVEGWTLTPNSFPRAGKKRKNTAYRSVTRYILTSYRLGRRALFSSLPPPTVGTSLL